MKDEPVKIAMPQNQALRPADLTLCPAEESAALRGTAEGRVTITTRAAIIERPRVCPPVADPEAVAEAILRWAQSTYDDPAKRPLWDQILGQECQKQN